MAYIPSLEQLEGGSSSVSGIISKFDSAERIVPESKRPDGTLRKERKIRPGFTPPEDVSRFRTAKQVEADARKLPPGMVIGMARPGAKAVQAALNSASSANATAASKKNAKRKEKRHAPKEPDTPPDDWDTEEPQNDAPSSTPASPPPSNEGDAEKRLKALQKKLRQAEALQDREKSGEKLQPEQTDKIKAMHSLEAEIAALSISKDSAATLA